MRRIGNRPFTRLQAKSLAVECEDAAPYQDTTQENLCAISECQKRRESLEKGIMKTIGELDKQLNENSGNSSDSEMRDIVPVSSDGTVDALSALDSSDDDELEAAARAI